MKHDRIQSNRVIQAVNRELNTYVGKVPTVHIDTIDTLLEQATGLDQKGQADEAESGYRRILQVEPKHADALHRLGELLAAKGKHAEAKRLFKTLTVVHPDAVKAWLCLAQACENLGQPGEAVQPYLEAMRLGPDQADGFAGLVRVLMKLGRIEDINNALLSTLGCTAKPSVRKWRASDRPPAAPHKMPEARQLSS
jgi:tetratricopeptide (TPR) repeat protein